MAITISGIPRPFFTPSVVTIDVPVSDIPADRFSHSRCTSQKRAMKKHTATHADRLQLRCVVGAGRLCLTCPPPRVSPDLPLFREYRFHNHRLSSERSRPRVTPPSMASSTIRPSLVERQRKTRDEYPAYSQTNALLQAASTGDPLDSLADIMLYPRIAIENNYGTCKGIERLRLRCLLLHHVVARTF